MATGISNFSIKETDKPFHIQVDVPEEALVGDPRQRLVPAGDLQALLDLDHLVQAALPGAVRGHPSRRLIDDLHLSIAHQVVAIALEEMQGGQRPFGVLELIETDSGRRRQRLDELLDEFSIGHLRRTRASALSGGERRRVEIARALVTSPRFMLLDEPFAGIDPIAVADLQSCVFQLKEQGLGILITDHNVRETLSITDRAYILYEGRIELAGTAAEIVASDKAKAIYLGEKFRL